MQKDSTKSKEKTMKALVLGEDRSFTVQDVPIPRPRDGEVLVKILAAPINPSDIAFVKGFYSSEKPLPCVPGFEGSGIVVENGGGMIGWTMVNKRVAVTVQNGFSGTYGQYAIANSQEVMPIPSELTLEHASMSFVNPLTAIVMLNKVKSAGVKAIVHTAAASSLGRMMNRLFSNEGIPIINVVRRDEQVELLKKEGAKIVLNSEKEGFEQELKKIAKQLNATLCYDAVAGDVTGKILRALPKNSSIEIYGAMSQNPILSGLEIREIMFSNKTIKGFWLTEEVKDLGLLSKLNLIRKLSNLLKHELKSTISREISLDKFEEGLEYYMNNMTEGKVIVKPWMGYEEVLTEKEKKNKKEEKKEEKKKEEKKEEKKEKEQKKEEKKEQKKEKKKQEKNEENKEDKEQKKDVTPTPEPQKKTQDKVQIPEPVATIQVPKQPQPPILADLPKTEEVMVEKVAVEVPQIPVSAEQPQPVENAQEAEVKEDKPQE